MELVRRRRAVTEVKIEYIRVKGQTEKIRREGWEANLRVTEGKEFECMTSSRGPRGCKTFFQVGKMASYEKLSCAEYVSACLCPWLQRGNQAEGRINTAVEFSKRANISSPSLSLPSITSSCLCHHPTAGEILPAVKRGGKMKGR